MKILVAMSGGVDSSVAAGLLKEAGNECIGCTMKLYDNADAGISRSRTCCSLDDVEDARSVAYRLGMPYYVFNFSDDFRKNVINRFVDSYLCGMTPNPCIDCNRYMKFGKLYERAKILGCDHIATGHYARIEHRDGRYILKKAVDPAKDQSYVLYSMTQDELARTLFPLGGMTKTDARRFAVAHGFFNADKPDSQDICFVPDGDYARVIELHTGRPTPPGNFVDRNGNILGRHRGIIRYTVGQHKGLGIPLPGKRYVISVRSADNTVLLGEEAELYGAEATVGDVNWISGAAPSRTVRCNVKIRYRQPEQPATVTPEPGGTASVKFDLPQRAVTPGQAAVFYDGDTVLGGGVIMYSKKAGEQP